ncbi:MAG: YbjN domain-containing protein [Sphingomonadaceae bacterium]|nr:YbjN domain-containing protein [Sphingomonadaceae bacterium]
MVRKLIVASFAALLLTGAAHAQSIAATSPQGIVSAMQGAGYKAVLGKDSTGDPMISSGASGSNFVIYFYGCTKNLACKTVQFSTSYTGSTPSLARMNEWNATKRWGQAYVTDNGAARVQMDVDLEQGGMTRALFIDNVEYWVAAMAAFEKFIATK